MSADKNLVWINGYPYDSVSIVGKIMLVRRVYFWVGWISGVLTAGGLLLAWSLA